MLEVAYFACCPFFRIVTTLACVIPATLGDRFGTILTPNLGPDDLKTVCIPPPLPFGGPKVARAPTVWRERRVLPATFARYFQRRTAARPDKT